MRDSRIGTASLVIGLLAAPVVVCLLAGLIYTSLPLGPEGDRPYAPQWLAIGYLVSTLLLPVWLVGIVLGGSIVGRLGTTSRAAFAGFVLCVLVIPAWLALVMLRGGEVVCGMVPCNGAYTITVANRQARDLSVSFAGLDPGTWHVAPCSFRQIDLLHGPTFGRPVRFQATDSQGDIAYSAAFDPSDPDPRVVADDTLSISEQSPGECPEMTSSAGHAVEVSRRQRLAAARQLPGRVLPSRLPTSIDLGHL